MFAGATCADNSITGPGGSTLRAIIGLAPAFTKAAADIFRGLVAFQLEVDNVHLKLKYPDGTIAKDTVIALAAGADSVAIEASVALESPEVILDAFIELRDGEQVLFSGTQKVRARRGGDSDPTPPVPIVYAGPGASATDLNVGPADTTILSTDSLALRVSATDAQGQPVSNLVVAWSVKDDAHGAVSLTGVFKPSLLRGKTYVIARLPNGVRDSAKINFIPLPSQLALISGGSQTGIVGRALTQPIVVEARGSDNLPVPGALVNFAVTAGGGSVQPTSVKVDANGRASATLTLGNLVGVNSVQATIGSLAPVVVNATANPTGPGALEIVTTSASARAGVPLAQQPIVQLRDSLTNLITTSGREIRASVVGEGYALAGTTTANTDNTGKATFTNLQVNGPVGSAQLRFTLGTTTVQVLSATVTVGAGNARALSLDPQPSGSAMSGLAFATQPRVHLHDAFGNDVAAAGVPVTAALIVAGEGRSLGGTLTVSTDATGAAQFTNLSMSGTPGTTRLVFAAADSIEGVTSNEVTLASGQAAALMAVTSLVYADTAGASVPPTGMPSVSLRDAANNPVPGVQVKFRRHGGVGAAINAQPDTMVLLTTDANGNAALTSRRLQTLIGLDTVLVTAAGLNDTLRFVAAVTNGLASALSFVQEPSNALGGGVISPAVVVMLRDQYGNIAASGPSSTSSVTIALSAGGSTALLSGTRTVAATGGVATFTDLSVNLAGTGYRLVASTPSITGVASAAFDVGVGAAALVSLVSGDLQGALPNELLAQPIIVRVTDLGGNIVPDAIVRFAIDSGGGSFGTRQDTVDVQADRNGLATVQWTVGLGQQRITATAGTSTAVSRAYVASRFVMVAEPSVSPQSGQALPVQPRVRLVDDAGHFVRRAGIATWVELLRINPVDAFIELSGNQGSTTDADGIATFSDLVITGQIIQQSRLEFYVVQDDETEHPNVARAVSNTITLLAGLPLEITAISGIEHHLLEAAGVQTIGVQITDGWNPVSGAQVSFALQIGQANCALGNAQPTTDATGVATVDVSISGDVVSCVVEGSTPAIAVEGAQVLQRLYVAPRGTAVWTGELDGVSFNDSRNWLGGLPSPSTQAFIPVAAAFTHYPQVATRTALGSMFIETGALFNISGDTLVLADSLIADGIVNGANATVRLLGSNGNSSVRGAVQAKLMVGNVNGQGLCGGTYNIRGTLTADSLQVDCGLSLQQNDLATIRGITRVTTFGHLIQGDGQIIVNGHTSVIGRMTVDGGVFRATSSFEVVPGGTLTQNRGTVQIVGDATFSGFATLADGLLELGANFIHTGNGDNWRLAGALPHVTRFMGAGSDSRRLHWDAPPGGLQSSFGQLEFATTGNPGMQFSTSLSDATVRAGHTIVRRNAFLLIPGGQGPRYGLTTGSPNRSGSTGLIVEAGGQLTNNGSVNVVNNVLCLLTGVITGNFSCLTP